MWQAAVVFGGMNLVSGMFGSSSKRRAAERQARLAKAKSNEDIRRRTREIDYQLGSVRAAIGVSGVRGGSTNNYQAYITDEFRKEMDWMKKWGQMQYISMMKDAKTGYRADTISTLASSLQVGASWWGK